MSFKAILGNLEWKIFFLAQPWWLTFKSVWQLFLLGKLSNHFWKVKSNPVSHKVILLLFNCVVELLEIFPKLYEDLSNEKMDTIKDFLVSYIHVPIDDPKSEIVQELLERMGTDAVEGIKLQCGWEYRFSDSESPQVTQMDKPTANELTSLPTNNLDTECGFSKFSWLSEVARLHNRNFLPKVYKLAWLFSNPKKEKCKI